MEKERGKEDLEWFMSKNPTLPSSSSSEKAAIRTPSMPEIHHQMNGVFNPAGISFAATQPHEFPSLTETHPSQLPHFGIGPYYCNPDPYRNIAMPDVGGVHVSPSFSDTLCDSLDANFGRLSLSTAHHHPSSAFSSLGNNSLMDSSVVGRGGFSPQSYLPEDFTNLNLQRRRVHSAARAQMDLYVQQQQQPPHGFPGLLDETFEGFGMHSLNHNPLTDFGGRSFVANRPRANRNGVQWYNYGGFGGGASTNPNRNGFRLDNNIRSRTRSTNELDSEDSSVLMSSLCDKNQLYGSRQGPNFSSLEDLKGNMFVVAKDQNGCRFLEKKFEERSAEEINLFFSEVQNHLSELMTDQFGNYLVQKFFEVCDEERMTQILRAVISDENNLMAICLDSHGTRAMQKLLEHLTTQHQKSLVLRALTHITVDLTKSMNGHHVIQHCLKLFSNEDNELILNSVADNCLDIATDKSGCCVLQHCVAHAQGEAKERLVAEITANALVLAEHPYGNYVVQYILGLRIPHVTADILAQLRGSYVSLSMNKYGSNVVEKCLRETADDQSAQIIREIIGSSNFLDVLQDPFGNYVVQSAFTISKGNLRQMMVERVQINFPFLHSHPYGKRVLAKTRSGKRV